MSATVGHSHEHGTPDEVVVRVAAIETVLVEKGLVDPKALDAIVEQYEHKVGPRIGARVVARAWADPAYRARLLKSANDALAELGVPRLQGEDMVVVENTEEVHNVIVCTLCSCYPWGVLGLPPKWYKAPAYRAQIVRRPREVLRWMGLEVEAGREIRVWDSTSELRYMVLPRRPAAAASMSEEQLAGLVTRDAMIGTSEVAAPGA